MPTVPTSVGLPSKLRLGASLIKWVWSIFYAALVNIRFCTLSKINCLLIKCKNKVSCLLTIWWLETESSACSQTGGKTKRVRISFVVTLISTPILATRRAAVSQGPVTRTTGAVYWIVQCLTSPEWCCIALGLQVACCCQISLRGQCVARIL